MKDLFYELFDYNFYCNKNLIDKFQTIESQATDKSSSLFSHILNAHHIWNARLLKTDVKYKAFDKHSGTDFSEIHYENQRTSFEIISNLEDFDKRIAYENSEGKQFINTTKDILFHIINHSTYHRGQIALEFRTNTIEPLISDYILYKR
ncbi:DinB family protein [Cellulophaga sp. Hel_I_12]|uniref:DinB family protein n=1 Tax=Cellulophaga sp. Hel_I_12 TaxID=1249972 RepID=UPI000647A44D|nr:DinB family protein [Cellulophaga sp. Hel_I_12]